MANSNTFSVRIPGDRTVSLTKAGVRDLYLEARTVYARATVPPNTAIVLFRIAGKPGDQRMVLTLEEANMLQERLNARGLLEVDVVIVTTLPIDVMDFMMLHGGLLTTAGATDIMQLADTGDGFVEMLRTRIASRLWPRGADMMRYRKPRPSRKRSRVATPEPEAEAEAEPVAAPAPEAEAESEPESEPVSEPHAPLPPPPAVQAESYPLSDE